jgi:hypothetical protein
MKLSRLRVALALAPRSRWRAAPAEELGRSRGAAGPAHGAHGGGAEPLRRAWTGRAERTPHALGQRRQPLASRSARREPSRAKRRTRPTWASPCSNEVATRSTQPWPWASRSPSHTRRRVTSEAGASWCCAHPRARPLRSTSARWLRAPRRGTCTSARTANRPRRASRGRRPPASRVRWPGSRRPTHATASSRGKTSSSPRSGSPSEGFELDEVGAADLARGVDRMKSLGFTYAVKVYGKADGKPLAKGERLVQADLAKTLRCRCRSEELLRRRASPRAWRRR